jgi:hypothetical protein
MYIQRLNFSFQLRYEKKTKKTTIKYTSSSSYPQLFLIRPGMAQVFIRQRCRHFGFTDDLK